MDLGLFIHSLDRIRAKISLNSFYESDPFSHTGLETTFRLHDKFLLDDVNILMYLSTR